MLEILKESLRDGVLFSQLLLCFVMLMVLVSAYADYLGGIL